MRSPKAKKEARQKRALERQENPRTPEQQLAHLDALFGVGKGAQKERAKIAKKLNTNQEDS